VIIRERKVKAFSPKGICEESIKVPVVNRRSARKQGLEHLKLMISPDGD